MGPWSTPNGPQQQPPAGTYQQQASPQLGVSTGNLAPYASGTLQAAWAPGQQAEPHPEYWIQPTPLPQKKKTSGLKVTNIILLSLLGLVVLATLGFFAVAIGASVFLVCGALALIPLTICVLTLRWIDRWEPEPKSAMLLAFCWGAGMSVVSALIIGSWVQPLLVAGNASSDPDMLGAVVQAPLVEEFCKGAGVLLLFFLRRRTFDGPIDGFVYAGMIAAGFAFTENILYFGQALDDSHGEASGLIGIFIMRGLMSPFAHVMFTGALGACVGYAARYGGTGMVILAWFVGLIPAMFLHGLWNGMTFVGDNYFVGYLLLQVPLFILAIVGIILLRRSEAKLTRSRLADYVPAGWLSPQEVPMLASGSGRHQALAWARSFGASSTMKEFIRIATRLAFTRQRIMVDAAGSPGSGKAKRFTQDQSQELDLLNKVTTTRADLLARHQYAMMSQSQWQRPRY